MDDLYTRLLSVSIPADRISEAMDKGLLTSVEENINEPNVLSAYEIGIIGAGDFAVALAQSFKKKINVLIYDFEPLRNAFSRATRLSTNRDFSHHFDENTEFTADLSKVLNAEFIILAVPANSIPSVIGQIKEIIPVDYVNKQYVLVSKGFIGKGYIPHRWLERNGIPFEQIIWASGGNVAKDVVEKKAIKIAVVSVNKNRKARREFAGYFNTEYLVPVEYSGASLLACELGGILKNYYAGLGRYILSKYGEEALRKYKYMVRREFHRASRIVSSSPTVSMRAWVIRKASFGPAFWEDLDVTIRDGRNGFFGEHILNGGRVKTILDELGLVESFKTTFSTLSLFNRLSKFSLKRLPVLKAILDIYEELNIDYLDSGDAVISKESLNEIKKLEQKVLKFKRFWFF